MNEKYTCIIVDDESKAIELLADHINELYENIDIIGTYTHWQEALQAIRRNNFDLLFLDISMPGKTGIDMIALAPSLNCEVIFVTAHPEHALQAFEHLASGYLLKPVDPYILVRTVDKVLRRISKPTPNLNGQNRHTNSLVAIPNSNGIDYFNTQDIVYLEARNRYTQIVTKTSKILSSYNLGYFKTLITDKSFYQVHRSFIVNLNFLKRYLKNGTILTSNGEQIPVSKTVRKEFLRLFVSNEDSISHGQVEP